jgi:hypothetical protein
MCCTFHGLGPLTCSNSELTSVTINQFRHIGMTPWTGIAPSQGHYLHRTTQHKNEDMHLCTERDSNQNPSVREVQDHMRFPDSKKKKFLMSRLLKRINLSEPSSEFRFKLRSMKRILLDFLAVFLCPTGMRVYPKVSGLSAWIENYKWYSSLPPSGVVTLFCESV